VRGQQHIGNARSMQPSSAGMSFECLQKELRFFFEYIQSGPRDLTVLDPPAGFDSLCCHRFIEAQPLHGARDGGEKMTPFRAGRFVWQTMIPQSPRFRKKPAFAFPGRD
jgi:hypothetical protein